MKNKLFLWSRFQNYRSFISNLITAASKTGNFKNPRILKLPLWIPALLILTGLFTGCSKQENPVEEDIFSIAVFVPGMLEGSPTYMMMDEGVRKASKDAEVEVVTIEAGFNQAEWEPKLTQLAAEGKYDLIVSSNPAIPEICRRIKTSFPDQNFLILEGNGPENDSISTFYFKHKELAFSLGHFAALVTSSDMEGANSDLKVGLIAGQEYPEMMKDIKPGFEVGLKTVNADAELDFRILGNWYDADKAAELAESMFASGVDIIMPIAGSANQGVLSAAKKNGKYVIWYDISAYELEPGVVIGSGIIREDQAAYKKVKEILEEKHDSGESISVGFREGFLSFDTENKLYEKYVSEEIRQEQNSILKQLKAGQIRLETPLASE